MKIRESIKRRFVQLVNDARDNNVPITSGYIGDVVQAFHNAPLCKDGVRRGRYAIVANPVETDWQIKILLDLVENTADWETCKTKKMGKHLFLNKKLEISFIQYFIDDPHIKRKLYGTQFTGVLFFGEVHPRIKKLAKGRANRYPRTMELA